MKVSEHDRKKERRESRNTKSMPLKSGVGEKQARRFFFFSLFSRFFFSAPLNLEGRRAHPRLSAFK